MVWKLDRLARSLIHFTKLMSELDEKGVKFRSITESFIDTTKKSSQSEFIINIFAALAQLERDAWISPGLPTINICDTEGCLES